LLRLKPFSKAFLISSGIVVVAAVVVVLVVALVVVVVMVDPCVRLEGVAGIWSGVVGLGGVVGV
jgi:hypothetical protein